MILKEELLDYNKTWGLPDIYIFTGNRFVTAKGKLVMGKGAALQCRDKWVGCDKAFGDKIINGDNANYYLMFHFIRKGTLLTEDSATQILGAFQVKRYYNESADLSIISRSTSILASLAKIKPHITFHMNYPGIGSGKLKYESVSQIVEKLPNNVILYK